MTIEYTKTYTCDVCGKQHVEPEQDHGYPDDWGRIHISKNYDWNFCPSCAHKHFLIAAVPGRSLDDTECWVIDGEQIKALAQGVPAEDIFV